MALSATLATGLFLGPPAYEPRTPWRPLQALVASVLILLTAALLAIAAWALARLAGVTLGERGGTELWALLFWQGAMVALTVGASGMLGGRAWSVLALGKPAGGPLVYVYGLLLMAALQMAVSLVQYAFFRHDMYADLRPFVQLFGEHWMLALLVVAVGAPLSEELLFRGFLLSALGRSSLRFWGAALITAGLWTALHAGYSTAGIVEVLLIGLYFSWLLWRTGSLRVPIVCHGLYNALVVLALRYVPLPA
jgi:uncharacterized protein